MTTTLTEELQRGNAPDTEATASVTPQASEESTAAIAVADEPATTADGPIAEATPTQPIVDEPAPAAMEASPSEEEIQAPTDEAPEAIQIESAAVDVSAPIEELAPEAVEPEPATQAVAAPEADVDLEAPAVTLDADDTADAPAADDEPEAVPPPRVLGPEPTTMEELLAEQDSDIKSFKHGDVVDGTVVRIDKDEILVDIGAKSEGVVSNRELFGRQGGEGQAPLSIGDVVLVYVLQPESPEGHAVLSLRRAGLERKWRAMQEQFEEGVIIDPSPSRQRWPPARWPA